MTDYNADELRQLAEARVAQLAEQTEFAEARARFDALFSDNWKEPS